jgi:protein-export membrane protein SecD
MQRQTKTRSWLIIILLLTVAAFAIAFEPVTWGSKKDPDTRKEIYTPLRLGKLHFYPPYPRLNLGLDLRGGSHLVLQCQKTGVYQFQLPGLSAASSDEQRTDLHSQALDLLPPEKLRDRKREVEEITGNRLVVKSRVKGDKEQQLKRDVATQGELILKALQEKFPEAKLASTSVETVKANDLPHVRGIIVDRVDRFGVAEPLIQVQEPDKIVVELPGIDDPERAKRQIQKTAVLEFRHIPPRYARTEQGYEPIEDPETGKVTAFFDSVTRQDVEAKKVLDRSKLIATGKYLRPNSRVETMPTRGTVITFEFMGKGARDVDSFSRKFIGHYLAVVLDEEIISCPVVRAHLRGGSGVIESPTFNTPEGMKEAKGVSDLLNSGALPVDLEVVEERVVSATLGKDELTKSLLAGLVGMILVLAFMVAYYRLPGLLADAALVIYCLFLLAAMRAINATLTLPGVFGLVLSVGMAVDANVIIFERLKEELRSRKTLKSAIDAGFDRAWTAILDSNVCSLITGTILFWQGTGAIKGFAVALIVGVAVSMFTAVFVSRLFIKEIANTALAQRLSLFGISEEDIAPA